MTNLAYYVAVESALLEKSGLGAEIVFEVVGWEVYEEAEKENTPVEELVNSIDFERWEFDIVF